MPLVRFNVRNVYGLGTPDLYATQAKKDDPNAILDGVAVAGLVGVLRQLGDLAEFAAEVFHGLQEQVVATSSRSHKMIARLQLMEDELPRLEKVVFSQTEHIHFAYTSGSDWHPDHRTEENRIVASYLPPFMMDSYEECRDPPSLHLLDKFDIGGSGACLKRYSDPDFFRRKLTSSDLLKTEETHVEKKARRSKKYGLRQKNVEVPHTVITPHQNGRMQFTSPNSSQKSSTGQTISMPRSEREDGSSSYGSRRSDSIDFVLDMRSCVPHKEEECDTLMNSTLRTQCTETIDLVHPREQTRQNNDVLSHQEDRVSNSSSITWDEKTEILKSPSPSNTIIEDQTQITKMVPAIPDQNKLLNEDVKLENADSALSTGNMSEGDDSESENYMDALTTTSSEIDNDAEKRTKMMKELLCVDLKNETNCGTGILNETRSQSSASPDVQPGVIKGSQDISNAPEYTIRNTVNTNLIEVTHIDDVPRETGGETSSTKPLSPSLYNEKTNNSVCSPKGSVAENSCSSSVNLWTNGGLLGLEPSKPPDFNVLDSGNQNLTFIDDHSISSDETHCSESPHSETVSDVSGSFQEADHGTNAVSFRMFQPRYRLVANNFPKRASPSHDDTPKPYKPPNSRASSPPLEHMRISFHPLTGSDTTKMKLEFQDENKESKFPSFQLLPEPDINSESDGDTFSRSSEYMSDQLLSELESNSEQWACDETPLNEENEIYDALRRVSSAESISKSSERDVKDDSIYPNGDMRSHETENGNSVGNISMTTAENEALRRVSSAKSISRSSEIEVKNDSIYPDGDLRSPKTENGNPCQNSSTTNVLNEKAPGTLQLPNESLPPPPPLPPPLESKKPEELKMNGQKVPNQVQNSSNVDEKDDFLNQIRLKSLSLKPAASKRPALNPRPVTDMRVTAILLKANALRQAFMGSDDEEDSDDWSDS